MNFRVWYTYVNMHITGVMNSVVQTLKREGQETDITYTLSSMAESYVLLIPAINPSDGHWKNMFSPIRLIPSYQSQ